MTTRAALTGVLLFGSNVTLDRAKISAFAQVGQHRYCVFELSAHHAILTLPSPNLSPMPIRTARDESVHGEASEIFGSSVIIMRRNL